MGNILRKIDTNDKIFFSSEKWTIHFDNEKKKRYWFNKDTGKCIYENEYNLIKDYHLNFILTNNFNTL